mmetsp:Transcript_25016/g.30764  ORF Transcript_25016/g.30764 Transcript_25016/m.30764 type:complete len:262 (+) Transcript_25016:132-917(+)
MSSNNYNEMGGGSEVTPSRTTMVNVIAPATLPEGYTFEAIISDRTFTVTVPVGGVTEGQTFLAPLPPNEEDVGARVVVPTGKWKDGIFGCLNVGVCHPHLCCALICTQVAMAQVMKRMKLTWTGEPGEDHSTANTFKIVMTIVVAYCIYSVALDLVSPSLLNPDAFDDDMESSPEIALAKIIGSLLFTFYSIYSLCRTRQSVREKFHIPEENCCGCEDLCCSLFCSCCTAAQMARHTGEYETYPGMCCTETGLPSNAPVVV